MPDHADRDANPPSEVTVWNVLFVALVLAVLLAAMMLWAVRYMSCRAC